MKRYKILIVEDERIVARDIERKLNFFGYNVVGNFPSAEKALKIIKNVMPDIVLMDISLKGNIDGIEAAKYIKNNLDIPVIFITAYSNEELLEKAKTTEPFAYIIKPFDDRELYASIEIAIYKYNMEKELKKSEKKYRLLFEDSKDGLFIINKNGNIVEYNKSFLTILNLEDKDIELGKQKKVFFKISDLIKIVKKIRKDNYIDNFEARIIKKDGRYIDCLITINPIEYMQGTEHYFGRISDITYKRELETQLFHAQKMEAIGTFASKVAHDLNNIIAVINGNCELLSFTQLNEKQKKYLENIKLSGDLVCDMAKSMLTLSKKYTLNKTKLNILDTIKGYLESIEKLLPHNISIKTEFLDNQMEAIIDPSLIMQVILNLTTNAIDAMPNGGLITLRLKKEFVDETAVGKNGLRRGEYASIDFIDNGYGMEKNILDKIFEPFFTSKGKKGTGLGLKICYDIIENHGGLIKVFSEPGKGTCFNILLPLAT